MNGCAPDVALMERLGSTRKWAIGIYPYMAPDGNRIRATMVGGERSNPSPSPVEIV